MSNEISSSTSSTDKFPPVTLTSAWSEILGLETSDMSVEVRKARWEEWKQLAGKSGKKGKEALKYWSEEHTDETCSGCVYKNKDWCNRVQLPCSVNPILTLSLGIIGMACSGTGYESVVESVNEKTE